MSCDQNNCCECGQQCGTLPKKMNKEQFRQFREGVFNRIHEKMEQKNSDYTAGSSVFANFEMTESIGIKPINGLLIRFLDKVQRLKSFAINGKLEVTGEGVTDAWEDIIGYSFIALGLLWEAEQKENTEKGD